MSDGEVVVRFTSQEDARLFDAFVKVAKMASDAGDKLKTTSAAADRIDASLKRFAETTRSLNATPVEKLTSETEKLDRALKANLLTAEEHGRAMAAAQDRYQQALRKTAEERANANPKPDETPVDSSLARFAERIKDLNSTPVERLTSETEKLDRALKANLLTAEEHGRAVASAQERYQQALLKTQEALANGNPKPDETPVDSSLARFAEKIKDLNSTPLEKLTAETERLDRALKANLLTAEEHGRAMAAAQQQFAEANTTDAERGKAEALKAHEIRLRQIRQAYAASAISAEQFSNSVERSTQTLNAELADIAAEANGADRELRRLAASARDAAQTPLDRLNDRMVKLGALLHQNRIRQDEFKVAAKSAADEFQRETDESIAKLAKLERSQQGLGKSSVGVAEESKGAFLGMSVSAAGAYTTIAATAYKVLGDLRREADEASAAARAQAGSRGALSQLVNSPQELQQLTKKAREIREMGGAGSLDEANRFVFAMQSAGAMDEAKMFARMKSLGVLERPEETVKFASAVRKSFGAEAGTFRDVLNRAMVAAGSSPENAEQVLKGTARTGVAARVQGVSTSEAMAAVSLMSSATGSGEEAGTRVAAFLRGVASFEPSSESGITYSLRGKSLRELLEDPKIASLSPSQLQKVAGGAEGAQFYGVARENLREFIELSRATKAGVEKDLLKQKESAALSDPTILAVSRRTAEEGRREIMREPLGREALRGDLLQSRLVEAAERKVEERSIAKDIALTIGNPLLDGLTRMQGDGRAAGTFVNYGSEVGRFFVGDKTYNAIAERLLETLGRQADSGNAQLEAARIQARAAEKQEQVGRQMERTLSNLRLGIEGNGRQSVDWTNAARLDALADPE